MQTQLQGSLLLFLLLFLGTSNFSVILKRRNIFSLDFQRKWEKDCYNALYLFPTFDWISNYILNYILHFVPFWTWIFYYCIWDYNSEMNIVQKFRKGLLPSCLSISNVLSKLSNSLFYVHDSRLFRTLCGSLGRLDVLFINLFIYICWSYRMIALMLCYHSTAPSTCKDDIIASAICPL